MREHLADKLFAETMRLAPYPPGVAPIPSLVNGLAFYPAGRGVWHNDILSSPPPVPVGRVMVLGNNFGTVDYYTTTTLRQESPTDSTWRPLLASLRDAAINPADCFFTNVLIGLIEGQSLTDEFPGLADPRFVNRCLEHFEEQLRQVKPCLLLTLGKVPARLVARLSPDLASWRPDFSFAALDRSRSSLAPRVTFKCIPHPVTCAALVHPCFKHSNVRHRRFESLKGQAAETALLNAAAEFAGLRPQTPRLG